MRNPRMALAVMLVAVLAAGCEAQTTVVTAIEFPSEIASSARLEERLHVKVHRATSFTQKLDVPGGQCPPFDFSAQASSDGPKAQRTTRGLELSQSAIPSVPEFCAAAWFDANGNGKIDSGDAVGQLVKPYPCQPSKFIGSNRYQSPPVVLKPVP